MKQLVIIALMFVASIQCAAIKSEQSHGEHGKGKSGSHMGFFGSRGKRSVNTDLPSSLQPLDVDGHEDDNVIDWSALRDSLYDFERNIRAPKGFTALRGKKGYNSEEKRSMMISRNPEPFQSLRLRTPFEEASDSTVSSFKRTPNNQFFGMRGKKLSDYMSGSSEKRGKMMGFTGVRGKKSGDNFDDDLVSDQEIDGLDYNSFYKRVPNGFFGMRGKKEFF